MTYRKENDVAGTEAPPVRLQWGASTWPRAEGTATARARLGRFRVTVTSTITSTATDSSSNAGTVATTVVDQPASIVPGGRAPGRQGPGSRRGGPPAAAGARSGCQAMPQLRRPGPGSLSGMIQLSPSPPRPPAGADGAARDHASDSARRRNSGLPSSWHHVKRRARRAVPAATPGPGPP
jgi:hypothetical protein